MGGRLSTVVTGIERLSERTGRWLCWLMPAMVAVIAVEVAARYLFAAPTIWAYDSALLLNAWLGMAGGAFAMRRNAHIRVDILTAALPPRAQAALELVSLPLIAFFLLLIVWQVGLASLEATLNGSRRPTEWGPPLALFLVATPVGAALILLQLFANGVRAARTLAGRQIPS